MYSKSFVRHTKIDEQVLYQAMTGYHRTKISFLLHFMILRIVKLNLDYPLTSLFARLILKEAGRAMRMSC